MKWNRRPFIEIAQFPPKIKLEKGKNYSFIPMEDVNGGEKYASPNYERAYTGGGAKFEEGDTIFARITPCLENGKIAQAKNLKGGKGFGSTEYFVFRGVKDVSDSDFIYYLSKTYFFWQNAVNSMVGTSGRQRADAKFLSKVEVPFPPLLAQRKISSILSAYDDLIENNLKRIKLLEELAQITFNDWFAKAEGLPKGWEEVNLGLFVDHEIGGGWGKEVESTEFCKPAYVIRGTDIDELPNGKIENVPLRFHKKSNLASRKLQDGDIVFEVSGGSSFEGVAKTLLITDQLLKQFNHDVMCASFCKLMRPEKREHTYFLFHFLRFLRQVKGTEVFEKRSASNIVNYNWTAFLKFQKVKKPTDDLIEKFNMVVEPIHKQIYNLGHQNQLLKEARDILLPRLMTGMIDVEKLVGEKETNVIPINAPKKIKREANWQIKEAVLISMLTEKFGSEQYPLGRTRYNKLSYLFHRNVDNEIKRFARQAAGMYNPQNKYKGPESIALKNGYVKEHKNGKYSGFVVANNIEEARNYFNGWWSTENMEWLDQFRFKSNNELGLYSVVDNALMELNKNGNVVSVEAIKTILKQEKEWQPKLAQSTYSDENIQKAIDTLSNLFDYLV